MNEEQAHPAEPRRDFLKKASAVAIGGAITVVPAAVGMRVLLDPLRHSGAGAQKLKVATVESLPKDGTPRKFPIFASRTDAWNKYPDAPIGAVYLRRTGDKTVEAFNVVCPHAGCFVDYRTDIKKFFCPCHNSAFALSGAIDDPKSPSPRGLDSLNVEIRETGEVWVEFQNFHTGTAKKVPMA